MLNQPIFSYAQAASGGKRLARPVQGSAPRPPKKGPFIPSPEWKQFVLSAKWLQDVSRALPKSLQPQGLRVMFGGCPNTFQEAAKAVGDLFPNCVSVHQNASKDFFDLGFRTKEEAVAAAKVPFTFSCVASNGKQVTKTLRTVRTKHYLDKSLYISFDHLPLDLSREEVSEQLLKGLSIYGEVTQFEMLANPFMANLGTSKAMATINPRQEVLDDLSSIPRRACFARADGTLTCPFKINPDSSPPICTKCEAIGHRVDLCPTSLEGLIAAEEQEFSEVNNLESSGLKVFQWGDRAGYKVVPPMTKGQKKAILKASKHAAPAATTAAEPVPAQMNVAPTDTQSGSLPEELSLPPTPLLDLTPRPMSLPPSVDHHQGILSQFELVMHPTEHHPFSQPNVDLEVQEESMDQVSAMIRPVLESNPITHEVVPVLETAVKPIQVPSLPTSKHGMTLRPRKNVQETPAVAKSVGHSKRGP